MASSVIILKPIDGYIPQKAIKVFEKAVIRAGMYLKKAIPEYDKDKKFIAADGCIGFVDDAGQECRFLFTVNDIDEYSDGSFEWLIPGKRLFWAIDIENIGNYHHQVFDLAKKYFSENPEDHLWLDSLKWSYSADEIEGLSRSPYDPMWLYKKLL